MSFDLEAEAVPWGPEIVCPHCNSKDWRLLDKGLVCAVCRKGCLVHFISNEQSALRRAYEQGQLDGWMERDEQETNY